MNNQRNISNPKKSYFGHWEKALKELDFSLDKKWAKLPGIYVFIDSTDQVLYIGRTVLDLENAMNRISHGYEAQVTNHRIHNHLLENLEKPPTVEVLAWINKKEHADLAAFFDDFKTELLQHISPIWNLNQS